MRKFFENAQLPAGCVRYNYVYCFVIKLLNGDSIFLTTSSEVINTRNYSFLPNSGINMIEAEFNDAAEDYIIITGIFEDGGIAKGIEITGAQVEIFLYKDSCLQEYLTYECSEITSNELIFEMKLTSIAFKYNQTIVKHYSKSCRANFCDKYCKLEAKQYSYSYEIREISGQKIYFNNITQENGYFEMGTLVLINGLTFRIISHLNNYIELEKPICDLCKDLCKEGSQILLMAGCNKKFITCCKKFNNAVNFRGEPFIPQNLIVEYD